MENTGVRNKFFFELAKQELPDLQFEKSEKDVIAKDVVISGFNLSINHNIKLNVKRYNDLTIDELKRVLIGLLGKHNFRIYENSSAIKIYPPLSDVNMSDLKHDLWLLDSIKIVINVLKSIK